MSNLDRLQKSCDAKQIYQVGWSVIFLWLVIDNSRKQATEDSSSLCHWKDWVLSFLQLFVLLRLCEEKLPAGSTWRTELGTRLLSCLLLRGEKKQTSTGFFLVHTERRKHHYLPGSKQASCYWDLSQGLFFPFCSSLQVDQGSVWILTPTRQKGRGHANKSYPLAFFRNKSFSDHHMDLIRPLKRWLLFLSCNCW